MRKLVVAGVVSLGLILVAGSQAVAQQNPVHWVFTDLEVNDGGSAQYDSPTAIEPTWPLYNFTYSITKVEIWLGLGWLDITSQVPPADRTGSGTQTGPCPIEIINEHVEGEALGLTASADVHGWVDAGGTGHVAIENASLAGFAKARMSGEIDAEGVVPEPTSMLLLACGATVALARRRR